MRPPVENGTMPTRVLLLRHAESANPLVFHGAESDIELSERGRRQAEAIAPYVSACTPHMLASSAMRRAVETATPIATACALPLRIEPDLHERRVGALSGTPTQQREGVWRDTVRQWKRGNTSFAPAGAESFDDIYRRVLPVWNRLTTEASGRTLVIVAHGIVCRVLLLSLLPDYTIADWSRIETDNVALNELLHDGSSWRAVRLNDMPPQVATI
jgi:probable phosphoglycerate mutase